MSKRLRGGGSGGPGGQRVAPAPGPPDSSDSLVQRYDAGVRKNLLLILASLVVTLILMVAFAALGATDTRAGDILATLLALAKGERLTTAQKVILHLRLPRVVMAVIAGVGLAVSGAAMQGITRNPLVSPFTIGISNAAAFGASLAIVFGLGIAPDTGFGIVLTAFALAFLCAALVYLVSLRVGMTPEAIVLTGIAVNYLFSAATSVIQYFADEYRLAAAVAWAFGSFNGAEWREAGVMAAIVGLCFIGLYSQAPTLNALSGGDDQVARSMGVNPARVRIFTGMLSVLATASVISFTGVIGFVGLAGPHIARLLIGGDHRFLLPFSALAGAILMLVSDTIGRLILAPVMIPVGIVVSFLGAPIFINLILTRRKEGGF